MDRKEIKEYLIDMYACGPEVETAHGLVGNFDDAGIEVREEDIQAACEELVADGTLQHAGRKGFEATIEFMRERDLIL